MEQEIITLLAELRAIGRQLQDEAKEAEERTARLVERMNQAARLGEQVAEKLKHVKP